MSNDPIGKTTPSEPPSSDQTDWARVQAMADEDIAEDEDNPRTKPEDWNDAIVSHSYAELREKLAECRRTRGPQKAPLKVPTTIRFDADVLAALKATGKGWQTRVNEVMRDWIRMHP